MGELQDIKREKLLYTGELTLKAACSKINIVTGFVRVSILPYNMQALLNSFLVCNPVTQYVPEYKTKKKQSVNISGKVLTDNTVIVFIKLGNVVSQLQIAAPHPRKKAKQNAPPPTSITLVVTEK